MSTQPSQTELLCAFPGVTWRGIRERYTYHFGRGKWRGVYQGQVRYDGKTHWEDTEEYLFASTTTQPSVSAIGSYPCCVLLRAARFVVHRPYADF